jgi:hypothetical protein
LFVFHYGIFYFEERTIGFGVHENVRDDLVNKKEKKISKGEPYSKSIRWEVSNVANRLGLYREGLNSYKKITMSLVALEGLTFVFGTSQQNGWKVSVSEFLTEGDYETFCKLYEDVYAHPPRNGDYSAIF